MFRSLLFCLACAATLGCASPPPPRPPAPVAAAPAELARLRIHVANATDARARADHEDDVTGYTMAVRGAVERALGRAGYVVVVDPDAPRDLEARIKTDYQRGARLVGGTLVTSLTLMAPGGVVEQLSGQVEVDENAEIDDTGAARLVESIARSERVARYASALRLPGVPCAPSGPSIATSGTRYRAGDYVVYRYSGQNSPSAVTLLEHVDRQEGDELTIHVTATRGSERREWLQVVTDTPENQQNNVVDQLFELVGGERKPLAQSELRRLYEWVLFEPDARAHDTATRTSDVKLAGHTFACRQRTGANLWRGRPIRFEENECPEFLWTHGPARYWDEKSNEDVWRVDVVEFGRQGQ